MGDEMQQEDWVAGWDSYRRRLAESAAKRAYERGYKDATIDAVLSNAKTRSKPVPGSIQWAVEQLRAGRSVKRKHVDGLLAPHTSVSHLILTFGDVMATDWQLAETPDSPCDSP